MYYEKWKQKLNNDELRTQMEAMSESEKDDAFYQYLDFGTAGLRGKMRPGTNSMNIYTVGKATQGIANYIISQGKENQGVLVAFDSRSNSKLFAKVTANVFAANGIKVYTFKNIKGVPHLSFGVRHLNCFCGIIITASHNPSVYNGYKAFDHTGSQISPVMAKQIIGHIHEVDEFEDIKGLETNKLDEKVIFIGEEIMDNYYSAVVDLAEKQNLIAQDSKLSIVYTPLFGSGSKPVYQILNKCGYKNIIMVEEQKDPDGNFPGMAQPNPEKEDCYHTAKSYAENADIILATDPDCDRLGVIIKDPLGNFTLLTGNQIACIIFDYLLKTSTIPKDAFAVRSIVSTPLVDKMAEKHHVNMEKVLTGFRYIADKINKLHDSKKGHFFFGFEESNGYLIGDFVRDKDACIGALLMSAAANYHKNNGDTVYDALIKLYTEYGFSVDKSVSYTFEGQSGKNKMNSIMENMSKVFDPFETLTASMENYNTLKRLDRDGNETDLQSASSNVLIWNLVDNTRIVLRPSGTEPKIKVYITTIDDTLIKAEKQFEIYEKQANEMIQND